MTPEELAALKQKFEEQDSVWVMFEDEQYPWPGTVDHVDESGVWVWCDCHLSVVRSDQVKSGRNQDQFFTREAWDQL